MDERRKGIRLFMRDGKVPRVWEADKIFFGFAVATLYNGREELATVKMEDLMGYEYVDLGPVGEQDAKNPVMEVKRADN